MTRQIACKDTRNTLEFWEYHGNTAIERIIRQDSGAICRDWLIFDSVEEARDYFDDPC